MKKRWKAGSCLLLLVSMLLLPLCGVKADRAQGSYSNIIDEADIIDAATESRLGARMAQLDQKYETHVVILTVTNMQREELSGGRQYYDIQAFAQDFYDYIYSGGVEKTGIMLCVNMQLNNREYCVVTTGGEIKRFQKHMDYIYDRIYEPLHRNNYEEAADTFVDLVETKHKLGFYPPSLTKILVCAGIGLMAGWLVTRAMQGSMNNVKLAASAADYVVPGSFHVRRQNDVFLYSHVSQKARVQERSGGGGGGISIGSSGFSHGGGGGRRF